ncbi:acyl-CoA dehydrogenase family protein [Alicyclobacillus mengziensis]|uniref:Acyl-CoA dehydrogenase n=1 Tax=Alicyclobacillus mengziensis TaxID=2931921 RepID=A0A9X7Z6W4_9BACL|nr:acyl-CoA dehydrogenase family protein [Alicyclobacillus mengziensis]QSO46653.1 acyl-CoA dehydrogenase family protein [Alicyclobacillus mengziensis]
MDFTLSKIHEQTRELVRAFAQKDLAPGAQTRDEDEHFDRSLFDKMANLGITGIPYPEKYGGGELDHLANVIAIEEISKVDASVGSDLSIHSALASWVISEFATDAQKERYLTPLAEGQWLAAFSLTEANAGSDTASLRTTAVHDGNSYVLNGTKVFTSNGGVADLYIVFAKTDPAKGRDGISAFIIEKDMKGLTTGVPERKMGIRAHTVSELILDECRIPCDNILGQEGQGLSIAMRALESGRLGMSAQALGIAQAAYNHARNYAQTRIQFGNPLSSLQSIQFKLAEMAVKLETARLLVYQAAWRQSRGLPFALQSAMAKTYVPTVAMEIANEAIQIHGGYGFIRDFQVERLLRDAKITQIYTGTVEMQKVEIARAILGL